MSARVEADATISSAWADTSCVAAETGSRPSRGLAAPRRISSPPDALARAAIELIERVTESDAAAMVAAQGQAPRALGNPHRHTAPSIEDLGITVLGPDHWLATGVAGQGTNVPPVSICETADGGRTWVAVGTFGALNASSRRPRLDQLHGMANGQDNTGCALPSATPCHLGGWFLTNDGGQTWHGVPF